MTSEKEKKRGTLYEIKGAPPSEPEGDIKPPPPSEPILPAKPPKEKKTQ